MYKKYLLLLFLFFVIVFTLSVVAKDGTNEVFHFNDYADDIKKFESPENFIDNSSSTYATSETGPTDLMFFNRNSCDGVNDHEIAWLRLAVYLRHHDPGDADLVYIQPNFAVDNNYNSSNGTAENWNLLGDSGLTVYRQYITNQGFKPWTLSDVKNLNAWVAHTSRPSNLYGYKFHIEVYYLGYPEITDIEVITDNDVNITWTPDNTANNTYIEYNTIENWDIGAGTICYNGTSTQTDVNDLNPATDYYFRAWSYSTVNNMFGGNSTVLKTKTGGLNISCFDEKNTTELTYNIFISNEDGSQTYNYTNAVNGHYVNNSEIPTGNIIIQINRSGYYDRFYYITFNSGDYYKLNAYLPLIEAGTELKALNVVGPQTYFNTNPPIEDATIKISKYINETVGFEAISILKTDANGQGFLYLKNNEYYKINITKNNYVIEISDITTVDAIDSYTFRIYPLDYETSELFSFFEQVYFNADISGEYMQLGNITITFIDTNNTMTDTDIYILEIYNGVTTLVNHSRNNSNSFSYRVGSINTSRDHYIKLFYNSSAEFYDASPLDFIKFALYIYHGVTDDNKFSFDDRVKTIIGPMTINGLDVGWHVVLSLIISFLFLILLGPYDTGLALIGCGLMIALTQGIFSLWFKDTFPLGLITLIPIFIIMGVVWFYAKGTGGEYV